MPTRQKQRNSSVVASGHAEKNTSNDHDLDNENTEREVTSVTQETYEFEGKEYDTYQAMVDAKRERNRKVLMKSGLLDVAASMKEETKPKAASQRGIISKKRKQSSKEPTLRRKSSRIAGIPSDGIYVESERSGKFRVAGVSRESLGTDSTPVQPPKPEFFNGRVAEAGASLSIKDAIQLAESKWVQEDSVDRAVKFLSGDLSTSQDNKRKAKSPTSVVDVNKSLTKMVNSISVDDQQNVAKVTPDRIYSVVCHPSPDKLIVCAGDKQGYVGMWNVDDSSDDTDGVHLFRVHGRPVSCLSWMASSRSLLSASYDGSVRWLDVESQTFQEIFATYDNSAEYRSHLGRGLDKGYNYWTQYVCHDHRSASDQCFFVSTSDGTAMHVDLRGGKGKLTFHEDLSEKKINTLSLHSNGHTLASAGLDCCVRLWDIRKFRDCSRTEKAKRPRPLTVQHAGKSVNSAFFSPSGSTLLSTTMANSLDITKDAHLANDDKLLPTKRVRHDNHTGRWLTTFMAQWHPKTDIFVVGSMKRPRCIDLFDSTGEALRAIQGDALTAVASRCCFHPSLDKLVVVGGNSSGRVTVLR